MKRRLLIFAMVVIWSGSAFAADLLHYPPSVEGGNILIDIGLGFIFPSASDAKIKIPPLSLCVDYCLPVGVPISVGGLFAFHQWGKDYNDPPEKWSETWNYITGGIRGNWHWNIDVKWLDFYTGIFLGYTYFKCSFDNPDSPPGYNKPNYGGFNFGVQAGAHFYFTNFIGALVEIGYPYPIKAGLALKF